MHHDNPKDDPIIRVDHLISHYGESKILDDVSFQVAPGEIFLVIGGSGCGKTTLLKHMTGLLSPTSGAIYSGDQDIADLSEEARAKMQQGIGIAFQSGGLFNSMTVGENVALPLREYRQVDARLIPAIVRMKLSLVGLADAENRLPDALSGGMKKRAGLARALAADPPIVFFDEPSAGLDPIMGAGLDDLVLELRRLLGVTFVIVTHELDSIRKIADRILMLDRGQVLFEGTVAEAESSGIERVQQFFERRPDTYIAQRNL